MAYWFCSVFSVVCVVNVCRSELLDSVRFVIVPGQKCIKNAIRNAYTHSTGSIHYPHKTEGKIKIIDESLLFGHSIERSFYPYVCYLTLCALIGVVANIKKFQFCQDVVGFASLTVTSTGGNAM